MKPIQSNIPPTTTKVSGNVQTTHKGAVKKTVASERPQRASATSQTGNVDTTLEALKTPAEKTAEAEKKQFN